MVWVRVLASIPLTNYNIIVRERLPSESDAWAVGIFSTEFYWVFVTSFENNVVVEISYAAFGTFLDVTNS